MKKISVENSLVPFYPSTKDELTNRHKTLFYTLTEQFAQLYDNFKPQKYIIVNAVAQIIQNQNLSVGFAVENGIICLFSQTYENEPIFMNGNNFKEEITIGVNYQCEGNHIQIQKIKQLAKKAQNLSNNFSKGSILYLHQNLLEGCFCYKQCKIVALALSIFSACEVLDKVTCKELCKIICEVDENAREWIVYNILDGYQKQRLLISIKGKNNENSENQIISFCQQNKSKSSSIRNISSTSLLQKQKKPTKELIQSNQSISSAQQYFETKSIAFENQQYKIVFCKLDISSQQEKYHKNRAQICSKKKMSIEIQKSQVDEIRNNEKNKIESLNLAKLLSDNKISLEYLIKEKQKLDMKYRMNDTEVQEVLKSLHLELPSLITYCLIEGNFLMCLIQNLYYPETIHKMRKLLTNNKLSTNRSIQSKHLLMHLKPTTTISELIFSSDAGKGCGIFVDSLDEFELLQ